MSGKSETGEVTTCVVRVSGIEYDRLKKLITWFMMCSMTVIILGAFAIPIFGWALLITGLLLALLSYFYDIWAVNRFLRKNGWDGKSYPLKIVPEYQSFLHE